MNTIGQDIQKLRTTQAYQNFIAANPDATELPESVRAAINAELQQRTNNTQGTPPPPPAAPSTNKFLLIGGAIAAAGLLFYFLRKKK